jgi:hypothetical protein
MYVNFSHLKKDRNLAIQRYQFYFIHNSMRKNILESSCRKCALMLAVQLSLLQFVYCALFNNYFCLLKYIIFVYEATKQLIVSFSIIYCVERRMHFYRTTQTQNSNWTDKLLGKCNLILKNSKQMFA